MIGLLIRHGHAGPVGRWLAGRRPGVLLTAAGREQASQLARALAWMPLTAVYTSPLERAVETAHPLASDHGLALHVRQALTDVDFGDWTGRSLDDLSDDPQWVCFNGDRAHACPPGGEPLADVQRRIVEELVALASSHQDETVAIVTHAEPIRCALAAVMGTTLDDMNVEISPAHVSSIGMTPSGVWRVLEVNTPPMEIGGVS